MSSEKALQKCAISADAFRKLYLLVLVGKFEKGVYGLKRLQKTACLAERELEIKPYTFIRHHFGQYSEKLDEIKDQLISSGFINVSPLETAKSIKLRIGDKTLQIVDGGNRYSLTDSSCLELWQNILDAAYPEIAKSIRRTVKDVGYLKEQDLIELCYGLPEFKNKEMGETIIESNLPDFVNVPGLSAKQCEDIELAFSTDFVGGMLRIVDALEKTTIDFDKVEKVAYTV